MKLLLAFLALLVATEAVSFFDVVLEEWSLYKLQHNKNYTSDLEEKFRLKIFMDNKNKIAKHNSQFERGLVTYKMAMNKFGDMLHREFVSTMNGFKANKRLSRKGGSFYVEPANVELFNAVDWRKRGAVAPVKDQGPCGSCWAFSATGSLEGQYYRKTGKLVSLSEQNLVDCSGKYGNDGCNGGLMDNAFKYIKDNHGIDTEDSYPYEAEDDKCRYKPQNSGATDSGFVDLPEGDEDALKSAVATVGPISIAIDASQDGFQFYQTGVYVDPDCSSTELDHAVLLVGYGIEDGQDYWLVKNSWGETWGEGGYIKMARNLDNQCGVASSASYPLV